MEFGNQKNEIKKALIQSALNLGWKVKEDCIIISTPPSRELGDYATSCPFAIAKERKENPYQVAEVLKKELLVLLKKSCSEINIAKPGYLNFKMSNEYLNAALTEILKDDAQWGSHKIVTRQKVIVEYSSPNIAKLMHVGHLRSTMIGHALDNLYRHLGYDVISDNHIGDWGTQFGKLLVAYRLWSANDGHEVLTVARLEELYIRFNKDAKIDPELMDQARNETVKLQSGDLDTRKLWTAFCEASMIEFNRIYSLLDIHFDHVKGESFYEPMLGEVVQDALDKNIGVVSQGAVIISLDEYGLPPFMIRKSDGGFLYSTSDLATILWRGKNLHPSLVIYVVADQQELHFKQLFAAAKKLGYTGTGELIHVPFGLILGEDGKKMSTREGETVNASQFIKKAIDLARNKIKEKNVLLSTEELETIAENLGVSALTYNDLSRERTSTIRFDWDTMMNLKGSSAPYLLYTYVRIQGILRKEQKVMETSSSENDTHNQNEHDERQLLSEIVKFPETLIEMAKTFQPHVLVDYLNNLAGAFHSFYDRAPVLSAPIPLREKRLELLRATAITMLRGLIILGMKPVEKM